MTTTPIKRHDSFKILNGSNLNGKTHRNDLIRNKIQRFLGDPQISCGK